MKSKIFRNLCLRVIFFDRILRSEVVNDLLAGFKDMTARGTESVAFDDSVADGDGLTDADEVLATLRTGKLGAAGAGTFILHGFAIPASCHQK